MKGEVESAVRGRRARRGESRRDGLVSEGARCIFFPVRWPPKPPAPASASTVRRHSKKRQAMPPKPPPPACRRSRKREALERLEGVVQQEKETQERERKRRRRTLDGFRRDNAGTPGRSNESATGHAHGSGQAASFPEPVEDASTLNPLLAELAKIISKGEGDLGYDALQKVMAFNAIKHVATYVIDKRDNTILLYKKTAGKKKGEHTTCGGCDYESNIIQRINSLRLEMMDEMAMIPRQAVFSPLVLNGDVLLQVVLMDGVDETKCWSVEAARDSLHDVHLQDPDNVQPSSLRRARQASTGEWVRVSLKERVCDHLKWRTEDFKSFRVLKKLVHTMMEGRDQFVTDLYIAHEHPDYERGYAFSDPTLVLLRGWGTGRSTRR